MTERDVDKLLGAINGAITKLWKNKPRMHQDDIFETILKATYFEQIRGMSKYYICYMCISNGRKLCTSRGIQFKNDFIICTFLYI